jgi:uncharacterized membrane protein (Fun14 family)
MTDSRSTGREPSLRQSLGLDRHPLTRAKIIALGIALLMMGLGVVLALTTDRAEESAPPTRVASDESRPDIGLLGPGFAPTRSPSGGQGPVAERIDAPDAVGDSLGMGDLSPFMVKGGFGLFMGFAIGFAIRAFLRLAIVIIGFYLLVLTMLAHVGWVEIHWNLLEHQFGHFLSSVGGQFESFKTFLTGAIPASGLTVAGFAIGLRRR